MSGQYVFSSRGIFAKDWITSFSSEVLRVGFRLASINMVKGLWALRPIKPKWLRWNRGPYSPR